MREINHFNQGTHQSSVTQKKVVTIFDNYLDHSCVSDESSMLYSPRTKSYRSRSKSDMTDDQRQHKLHPFHIAEDRTNQVMGAINEHDSAVTDQFELLK
jgi:hypothetical protein